MVKIVKMIEVKWSHSVVSDSCDPMDCSPTGSSVHGVFEARVLEWVAISFSRRSSQHRDRTWVSCIVGRRFTVWASGKSLKWLCSPYCLPVTLRGYRSLILYMKGLRCREGLWQTCCFKAITSRNETRAYFPVFILGPQSVSTKPRCFQKYMSI